jgi:hypothetical protein
MRGAAERGVLASGACGESALVISHLEQGRDPLPCSRCEMTRPKWYDKMRSRLASHCQASKPLISAYSGPTSCVVNCRAGLWAGSRLKPAAQSRAEPEPGGRLTAAYGSGFKFGKPFSQAQAQAWGFLGRVAMAQASSRRPSLPSPLRALTDSFSAGFAFGSEAK